MSSIASLGADPGDEVVLGPAQLALRIELGGHLHPAVLELPLRQPAVDEDGEDRYQQRHQQPGRDFDPPGQGLGTGDVVCEDLLGC